MLHANTPPLHFPAAFTVAHGRGLATIRYCMQHTVSGCLHACPPQLPDMWTLCLPAERTAPCTRHHACEGQSMSWWDSP